MNGAPAKPMSGVDPSSAVSYMRYLDRTGAVAQEEETRFRFTSYYSLYRDLLDMLDALDRLQRMQQRAHVVVVGGVADPHGRHGASSLIHLRRC